MTTPPRYEPMLASSGRIAGCAEEYAFEPKWDGWRALVTVHSGRVVVRTRRGHDVTASVPELAPLADDLGGNSVVLDGELVAGAGTPGSFYRISGRLAARRPNAVARTKLTFVPFDIVWFGGDLTHAPF